MEQEMWVARDKDGVLAMFEKEPFKDKRAEQWAPAGWCGWCELLPKNWFPGVKWSDEKPTKVKLVIDK